MAEDSSADALNPVGDLPTEEPESEEATPEATLLNNLMILAPRQRNPSAGTAAAGLALPPLRAEEPVQSLRGALTEVVGYAHLTSFRFELAPDGAPQFEGVPQPSPPNTLVSPFTGPNAVVSIPSQLQSLNEDPQIQDRTEEKHADVLDEFGDLTPLLSRGLTDGSAFAMILERYDAAGIKDHVQRLNFLMDGNVPSVVSLDNEKVAQVDEEVLDEKSTDGPKVPPLPELPTFPNDKSIVIDGTNLQDFYYMACGEDSNLYHGKTESSALKTKKKKKKAVVNGSRKTQTPEPVVIVSEVSPEALVKEKITRLNELEDICRVPCTIRYSGFHPPPTSRRWIGDLAYLEVTPPEGKTLHITAIPMGFYLNRSKSESGGRETFDPSPAVNSCFAHALLDCVLQASPSLSEAWRLALEASAERSEILAALNNKGTFTSLFRVAIRGDFQGFQSASTAHMATQALDSMLHKPSWLISLPRVFHNETSWNRNQLHSYSPTRSDHELANSFGVDIRSGTIRDWNEELQLARELPTEDVNERIERARLIHKVMTEFGEASLLGVKAIADGQISPMNPNEPSRSQVYLHNNIFFSRAIDAGPETFKLAKGDRAAKKSANRDIQCVGTFHRMEQNDLCTLATVLIDFLGTRYVCQSILPGILIGEKSHTLLYGAVESGAPLKWNEDFHKLMEDKLCDTMMIATRPILKNPLTEERQNEIKSQRKPNSSFADPENQDDADTDLNAVMQSCIPVEAKGILGSDQRKYVLDFGRLTPRDANWVPEKKGGTGKWEAAKTENGNKRHSAIPLDIKDDEWTMCVLRPELVSRYTQVSMGKYLQDKKNTEAERSAVDNPASENKPTSKDTMPTEGDEITSKEDNIDASEGSQVDKVNFPAAKDEDQLNEQNLSEEDLKYLKSLRLNVNVFLDDVRSFAENDSEAAELIQQDEGRAREVAVFLWEVILPKITLAIKESSVHQVPLDGFSLTEFLHRHGVNCRYMGRLAVLAKKQEEKDEQSDIELKEGRLSVIERRKMPKCWLELLECEMVARAAKHVLDRYLTENGGVAAAQPAQTIASFLCALVSESEETAAQTETRAMQCPADQPDEDDYTEMTMNDVGGNGNAVPSPVRGRHEVWHDIEMEIGRRFRYSLSLFNTGKPNGRALHIPLLRRVCQRTGVRLVAKRYDTGGKCLCSSGNVIGGRLAVSYPISPLDIVDVVPLMKHAAAYNEGFAACSIAQTVTIPALHISLPDARTALERAHVQMGSRALSRALELAQEASNLYQRVTDSAVHPGVIESIDLMSTVFLEAGDPHLAAESAAKALGLAVHNGGFDTPNVFNAHMSLFQMLYASRQMDLGLKHLRAAIYLLEVMAGPNHIELFSAYHKLGTVYSHSDYDGAYLETALECFKEVMARNGCDRLMDGITAKNHAKILAGLGNYKDAIVEEKRAHRTLFTFLGKDHAWTKDCDKELQMYTKLAVEHGNKKAETDKKNEEAARADALAADLIAQENRSKKNKKKKSKK
jgi:protein TIF31